MASPHDPHETPVPPGREAALKRCVDGLATGTLTPEGFLTEVRAVVQADPEAIWELLAVLDRQFRLGRLTAGVFHPLRRTLQSRGIAPHLWRVPAEPIPAAQPAAPEPAAPAPQPAQPAARAVDAETPVVAAAPAADEDAAVVADGPVASVAPAESEESAELAEPDASAAPSLPVSDEAAATTAAAVPLAATLAPSAEAGTAANSEAEAGVPQPTRLPAVGDLLKNRYRLLSIMEAGSQFVSFAATDEQAGDGPTALTVKVAVPGTLDSAIATAELRREFHVRHGLSHPSIPRVLVLEEDAGLNFYVEEGSPATTLRAVLAARRGEPLPADAARVVLREVAAILAYAHALGVTHGGLCPDAVLLTPAGEVRLQGFGAAPSAPLTEAMGAYASPQRSAGDTPNPRDDIYSLACLANLLLVGVHPFGERSGLEARVRGLRPVSAPGLPPAVWLALRTGLDFERERRPGEVGGWMRQLNPDADRLALVPLAALTTPPSAPRLHVNAVVVSAVAIALAAAGLVAVRHMHPAAEDTTGPAPVASAPAAPATQAEVGEAPVTASPPAPEPAIEAPRVTEPAPVAAPAATPSPRATATEDAAASGSPARLDLVTGRVEVAATDNVARVVVRRHGNRRNPVELTWSVLPETARAGEDYLVPAERTAHFGRGAERVTLLVPLPPNPRRHEPRRFYVVLDSAGAGAVLGENTSALVVVPPMP